MDFRSYRIKSPVKSFRDLEVYQKTIQLSDEITNLPFLSKESFQNDNEEIKQISEKIPKLIAEAYGDKFDSRELAHKKLTEAITLITNAITKIDLLRQRFAEDKGNKRTPRFIGYNSFKSELRSCLSNKFVGSPDNLLVFLVFLNFLYQFVKIDFFPFHNHFKNNLSIKNFRSR